MDGIFGNYFIYRLIRCSWSWMVAKEKWTMKKKKVFDYIENQELSDLEELNLHLIENKDDSTLYGQDMNYGIFFKLECFLFSNIFHIFVFVFLLLFEASAQNTT